MFVKVWNFFIKGEIFSEKLGLNVNFKEVIYMSLI